MDQARKHRRRTKALRSQVTGLSQASGHPEDGYRRIFEDNSLPMLVCDKDSRRFLHVNKAACDFYQYSLNDFLHLSPDDFFHKTHEDEVDEQFGPRASSGDAKFDTIHMKSDRSAAAVRVALMTIPWGGASARLIIVQDCTERDATLATMKSHDDASRRGQRMAKFGDWSVDLCTGQTHWSDEIFTILGLPKEAGVPAGEMPHAPFFSPANLALMQEAEADALQNAPVRGRDYELRAADGTIRWVHRECVAEFVDGKAVRLIGTLHDISDRKTTEVRLEAQARIDALTGLPNRKAASEALSVAVARAKRSGLPAAVLFIDVDKFKNINDTLGHTAGDDLLNEIARRLRSGVRKNDFVGRMGGDEFVVILSDIIDPTQRSIKVAEHLQALIQAPIKLSRDIVVSICIGIAIFPDDGATGEELIMNADTAMYECKREGRSTYRFFSQEMHVAAQEQLDLDIALRRAIDQNEFTVHYQPIISLTGGRIVASEALVRWPQADGSVLSPAAFIPYAEENGLIVPLGNWVLRTACQHNADLNAATGASLRINVNVSAKQLADPHFADSVLDVLHVTNMHPELLVLELTETAIDFSPTQSSEIARKLRAIGVRIALDDFGTGYNSLRALRSLQIDSLKLDKCFVDEITHNVVDQAIASAVISAARSLGGSAVAEGVETYEQRAFLQELGFDEMQGYEFSKPIEGDALEKLLRSSMSALAVQDFSPSLAA
ncbi:MAG: EAL domain-containing protein [Candidatus Baltobacteraceae bacterium]